jgi:calcineurin-like phosphoesterase family protein
MPNIWFTADNHWMHPNIIKHCDRPFRTVEAMNEVMVERWNARVKPGDIVYHLGDFCWTSKGEEVEQYRRRLNGVIRLIRGNHDRKVGRFESVKDLDCINIDGQKVVLCHYPFDEWRGYFKGYWHLHGHCHGRKKVVPRRLDVGVDSWGFAPVSWGEIHAKLSANLADWGIDRTN